jgi:uncharacterized membrane protein YhaH (DUF805 family)
MENFNPFKFEGRIGRLQLFGFGVIWGVILFILMLMFGGSSSGIFVYFVIWVVYAIATVSYGIRRLHDFDKSGWWYLLGFVPLANFVLAVILLFAPGTQGANTYGVRVR